MDKALKAKWLEALRSGRYKQGQFRLRSENDKFCCLGVLCDISGEGEWEHLPDGGYSYKRGEEAQSSVLPQFLADVVDLADGQEGKLVDMNDGHWLNFLQISEWIEENIKGRRIIINHY